MAFRSVLLRDLKSRNKRETGCFGDLIKAHNKLFERDSMLRSANKNYELENMQLKEERARLDLIVAQGGGGKVSGSTAADKEKMFKMQTELTELHRKRGEMAHKVIELTEEGKKKDDQIKQLTEELSAVKVDKDHLTKECMSMNCKIKEADDTHQLLKDEHTALQLAYAKKVEKLEELRKDNRDLIQRWMMQKGQDADKVNKKNEDELQLKQAKLQDDIMEAVAEPSEQPQRHSSIGAAALAKIKEAPAALFKSLSVELFGIKILMSFVRQFTTRRRSESNHEYDDHLEHISRCFEAVLPTTVSHKFDAHEGEVVSCRFSSTGRYLATGGADRKLKLWEISAGKAFEKGVFVGSNAGITSAEFDLHEKLIVGSSNDHSARVWGVGDQRCRHTLTGHSGKVMTAKFLGDSARIVTGSHDRTLKVWDLRNKSCFRTIFAGSSCNDLVFSDGSGPCIISGHFDKRIRFWDIRSESSANEISLQGKVTSLDLSPDRMLLLSSSRDDSLKLIDLRMNQVTGTFCADGLKIGTDYSRACFSPDGEYVAAGSADGSLFVWRTQTGKYETSVKEHSACVVSCAWHPSGSMVASTDRNRKCIIWSNN
eukprot:m.34987 g.34987  ORF g.34987 m.34987 type:complete len:598 (+) comp32041_c0_seq6:32-1825(+)